MAGNYYFSCYWVMMKPHKVKGFMLKLKSQYSYLLFFLLFSTACAQTYRYNNIAYPDTFQALNALKGDLQNALDSITPRKNNLEETTKVILPSNSLIKKHGVVSGPLTPAALIDYITNGVRMNLIGLFQALKKRNIFKSVTFEKRDNTIDPELNGEAYLIWLEVKSVDDWKWYIKSKALIIYLLV